MEDETKKRIVCPNCGQLTRVARYCLHCHAEVVKQKTGLPDEHEHAFIQRAKDSQEQLQKIPLAQILVSDQLPDGTLPNLKRLVVQPGTFTVMVSQFQGTSVLQPGQYDCSRLGIGGGIKTAFQAGREPRPIFFCTVSQAPVTATFVLPDHAILCVETNKFVGEDNEVKKDTHLYNVDAALSRLGIRTSDNFLGGAQAQLVLRCINPARLLEMFIHAKLQSFNRDEKVKLGLPLNAEDTSSHGGGAKGIFTYSLAVIARLLWGGGNQAVPTEPVALRVWDVYCAIAMEFAAAIGQSVRNEPIAHLFDAVEVRDRVAEDIQRVMSQSFDMYGIKIDRVSAFRFICPMYEDLLKRRANIARDSQQLDDRRKEVDIAVEQRHIDLRDHIDSSRTVTDLDKQETSDKAERDRHQIKEDRETERDRGALLAEAQQRALAMDQTAHQHQLGKERAAEEQHLELQAEQERQRLQLQDQKMKMALGWQERLLELQNKQQDATVQRRIKMLEQYAKLPKDSILTIALAENPQLAAAYAASVQAQSLQDKAQMQERFRAELATAYAGNNAQFGRLLQEAVRQWGQYQTAKQIGYRPPQQVINVAVPQPPDGPPTDQGEPPSDSSP